MRKTFSALMESLATQHRDVVFITGDLGFNAFENLRRTMGERFINAGVAEQNMVSAAAGLASQGYRVFVYSIAPFLVYRALEQIRNDVCFHRLPVFLVGNGGGYGYGIMGSSHHALSDISTLSALPAMNCYIPAFNDDLAPMLNSIMHQKMPAYIRLGLGRQAPQTTSYKPGIQRVSGSPSAALTVVAQGPVLNNLLEHPHFNTIKNALDIFVVNTLPFDRQPGELLQSLQKTKRLFTFEEQVKEGSMASQLLLWLHQHSRPPQLFKSYFAAGYPDNRYGSQHFHQVQSQLDGPALFLAIQQMLSL